jgi:hypothetical protein
VRREVVDGDLTKSDPLPFNQGREDARDCALHVSSVLAIDEPRRAWVVLAATESSFGCQGDHRSIYADPRRPASTLLAASLAAGGRPQQVEGPDKQSSTRTFGWRRRDSNPRTS